MLTNTVAPDSLGGLERYVRELSAQLVASDCRVTIVAKRANAADPADELGPDGVQVVRYTVPSKKDPSFALRYPWVVASAVNSTLRRINERSVGETVVHGHFPVPALVPALRKVPFVYTLHAPVWRELLSERQDSYVLPAAVQRAAVTSLRNAERLVLKRATRVITLSTFMRNEVLQLDPSSGSRAELMAGGVDTDYFTPGNVPADPWADEGGPVLFTARRHVPRTGVFELVQAMPAVVHAFPSARLAIAGSGPQTARIEREIESLGLTGHVRLLGRVSADDLRAWYRRADLVVTPTQELEGFGLATAESLACGTPCLVTPVGANPEVVLPLSGDLVTADASAEGLSAGMVRILSQSTTLADLASRARSATVSELGWGTVVDRHIRLYERMSQAASQRAGGKA